MTNVPMGCFEDLMQAIIMQAVKDYRSAGTRLKSCPDNVRTQVQVAELEQFFLSDWFVTLSQGADGREILMRLREEIGI